MIRGGHMDMSILGAMQVDEQGEPRELDDSRQDGEGDGRGDGSGGRCATGDRCDGASDEGWGFANFEGSVRCR